MVWLGALYVLIVVTGFWLGRSGRPVKALPSAVHKLLAVALAVLLAILVFGSLGALELNQAARPAAVTLLAVTVSLVATGAVLSGKVRNKALVWAHGAQTAVGLSALIWLAIQISQ